MRSGHTEAAVDLARLAGEPPVGVIAELVNDDGTVKRGAEVLQFAREHGLKIISVADLIAWRQSRERLVEASPALAVTTAAGPARVIAYRTPFDPVQHLAVVFGDIGTAARSRCGFIAESVEDLFGGGQTLKTV
jgi:3,4-dihydroxy 2-butanone 4-phosphate synthase/GTP cyclohydrolase II